MLQNVTAVDSTAKKMKPAGRMGDTEMAHVTPGEVVVPLSVQTPEVMSVLDAAFESQGVPMERYTVRSMENSTNPETGKPEFFLGKLGKAVVGAGIGYATGGWAGAAKGAAGSLLGGSGGGGGGTAGSVYPSDPNPLPQTTKAFVQGGGVAGGPKIAKIEDMAAPRRFSPDPGMTADMTAPLPSIAPPSVLTAPGAAGVYSPAPSMPRVNPITGQMEFFDEKSSVNPKTGMQEFANTLTPQQVNDFLRVNNLGGDATKGTAAGAIANASPQVQAVWKTYSSVPGGASATPPVAAAVNPNAPQLATTTAAAGATATGTPGGGAGGTIDGIKNDTNAQIGPNGTLLSGSGGAAQPAASEYVTQVFSNRNTLGFGGERVLTSSGKIYDMKTDPMTGKAVYTPAQDLNGFSLAQKPVSYKYQDYTKAIGSVVPGAAPAPAPATNTTKTDTGGLGNGKTDKVIVTKNDNLTNTTTVDQPKQNNATTAADNRYFDAISAKLASLENSLNTNNTTSSNTNTVSNTTATDEPMITRTSSLTPERSDRFRSRSRTGGMARNF